MILQSKIIDKLDELNINISHPNSVVEEELYEKLKLGVPVIWEMIKPSIKSFLTTTLIPLIQEEERARCLALIGECKGEMEKVYEEKARVASPDNSDYMFSLAQFNRVAGVNQGVSTCISILEDKLKELK